MKNNGKSVGLLTRFFKFLFRGKVKTIERALQDDPRIKQETKELHRHLDELTKYVNDNIGDYGT